MKISSLNYGLVRDESDRMSVVLSVSIGEPLITVVYVIFQMKRTKKDYTLKIKVSTVIHGQDTFKHRGRGRCWRMFGPPGPKTLGILDLRSNNTNFFLGPPLFMSTTDFLVWCVSGYCNMLLRQSCSKAMLF